MLVDVFHRRYQGVQLRGAFEERDKRLLVQLFRILSDDLVPYYSDSKENPASVSFWTSIEKQLSRELGLRELSPHWTYYTSSGQSHSFKNILLRVCEIWLIQGPAHSLDALVIDTHVKERLSLIELGFRAKEAEVTAMNNQVISETEKLLASLIRPGLRVPGTLEDGAQARRASITKAFENAVNELNTRFRQAGYPLNYHSGFIQMKTDDLIQNTIENPFWSITADPKWKNVDLDMKEALDLRDNDGKDPEFYAARALESAIKIISDDKGWITGREKGAHNFIDNLASNKNRFILSWEGNMLKEFFTHVRNPVSHGSGSSTVQPLSRQQTEWAIEFSMSWIKNLITRV